MDLRSLQVLRVRNIDKLVLEPDPKINLFTGVNASGKTAILEAIYLLSCARSFRTARIQEVIQEKQESLLVQARINHELSGEIKTGLEKRYGEFTIRRNGETIRTVSDQASQIPVILITQDSQTLVTGAPKVRRHWLDWAMFHVEPEYLGLWKEYIRALRQRNYLLKQREKRVEMYRGWEQAMVELAIEITDLRQGFLEGLETTLRGFQAHDVAQNTCVKLVSGWPGKKGLLEVLQESRAADMERGFTRAGIHQADVRFSAADSRIAARYSRGQIKIFVVLLLLAQARQIQEKTRVSPILLIDDFKAELDQTNSEYLLTWLYNEKFQSFLTTTAHTTVAEGQYSYREFHVEHGEIIDT